MRRNRNQFIEGLRRKQEALRPTAPKDPSEMSAEDLDAETQRLKEELRAEKAGT